MLQARKPSSWRGIYEITLDGRPLTTWTPRGWRLGGAFDLDGQRFEVRADIWGRRYGMTANNGEQVATADRVGRKRWSVQADGHRYEFVRASAWTGEQALLGADGRHVGTVRRVSVWRGDAIADLPGLPLPVQVFALVAVLTVWDAQSAAAASS
jgi:hypothetical protein